MINMAMISTTININVFIKAMARNTIKNTLTGIRLHAITVNISTIATTIGMTLTGTITNMGTTTKIVIAIGMATAIMSMITLLY